jgi:hypothetical protein
VAELLERADDRRFDLACEEELPLRRVVDIPRLLERAGRLVLPALLDDVAPEVVDDHVRPRERRLRRLVVEDGVRVGAVEDGVEDVRDGRRRLKDELLRAGREARGDGRDVLGVRRDVDVLRALRVGNLRAVSDEIVEALVEGDDIKGPAEIELVGRLGSVGAEEALLRVGGLAAREPAARVLRRDASRREIRKDGAAIAARRVGHRHRDAVADDEDVRPRLREGERRVAALRVRLGTDERRGERERGPTESGARHLPPSLFFIEARDSLKR